MMPGFAAGRRSEGKQIEVGSGGRTRTPGRPGLRRIGSYRETRTDHSVLLRLHLSGSRCCSAAISTNKRSVFLLNHYAGRKRFPAAASPARVEHDRQGGRAFQAPR